MLTSVLAFGLFADAIAEPGSYELQFFEVTEDGTAVAAPFLDTIDPRNALSIGGEYVDTTVIREAPFTTRIPEVGGGAPVLPDESWAVQHWDKSDGLPDTNIRDLLQTSDGYLWIATTYGLARYDGHDFRVFDERNTAAFREAGQICTALAEHPDGSLWISVDNGLICKRGAEFKRIEGVTGRIEDVEIGDAGGVYFGSPQGFQSYRDGELTMHRLPIGKTPEKDYRRLLKTYDGGIWFGGGGGTIGRIQPHPYKESHLIPAKMGIKAIVEDSENNGLLLGSSSLGLLFCDPSEGELKPVDLPVSQVGDSTAVTCLYADREGKILAGVAHRGLLWRGRDSEQWERVPFALSSETPRCVIQDSEGAYWIGTYDQGLFRAYPRPFLSIALTAPTEFQRVRSVAESANGSIWIAAMAGVAQLTGNRVNAWFTTPRYGVPPRGLSEDTEGRMWLTFLNGGSYYFDPATAVSDPAPFTLHPENPHLPHALQSITHGRAAHGRMWTGTNVGLFYYDHDGAGAMHFDSRNGMAGESVTEVSMASDGTAWIATNNGVLRFKGVDDQDNAAFDHFGVASGLPHHLAACCLPSAARPGILWVGTEGGVAMIKDDKVTGFTRASGLPQETIRQLLEDDQGRLWAQTREGIFRVAISDLEEVAHGNRQKVRARLYLQSDGIRSIASDSGFQNQSCKTRDGRLWFATYGGVAVVDPSRIEESLAAPPVSVDAVLAGGKAIFDQGNALVTGVFSEFDRDAELPIPKRGAEVLEFQFSVRQFTHPDRAGVRYQLVGFDDGWRDAGARREVRYTNLAPGDYEFRLMASNLDGVWSAAPYRLGFSIPTPFVDTWWFRSALALCALTLIWIAFVMLRARHREKSARERRREMQDQRTRMATELHAEIGASVINAMHRTSSIDADPEAKQTVHDSLSGVRNALLDLVWLSKPVHDNFRSLQDYLVDYAQAFLSDAGIRVSLQPDLDGENPGVGAEQRRALVLAFKEALNNVVKHSGAKRVTCGFSATAHLVEVSVEDDGRGMDPDGPSRQMRAGIAIAGGNGLTDMDDLMQSVGGAFSLNTTQGGGTVLRFSVPCAAAEESKGSGRK